MAEDIILAEYPDGQQGMRKTLPPLPMVRKSTHSPMSESVVNLLPSQADLDRLEARGKERHRLQGSFESPPFKEGSFDPETGVYSANA